MDNKRITNEEFYTTEDEQYVAFAKFCKSHKTCEECELKAKHAHESNHCRDWLKLPAPIDDLLPCPFCGGQVRIEGNAYVYCPECGYQGNGCSSKLKALKEHNKICKSIAKGKYKNAPLDNLLAVCKIVCPSNDGYEEKCSDCKCKRLLDQLKQIENEISEYRENIERKYHATSNDR